MMRPPKLHTLLLPVLACCCLLQGWGQPTPAILKPLLRSNLPVGHIILRTDTALFTGVLMPEVPDPAFPVTGRSLVKTAEGLFLHVGGTGRLYRVTDSSGYLQYRRIDSTAYAGHSFGSLLLSHRNQVLSIGGYGFWRANGQVRVFRGPKEGWEIIPVSEEVCLSRGIVHMPWLDAEKGDLYLVSKPEDFINQSIKGWQEKADAQYRTRVMRLNLATGDWQEMGTIGHAQEWKYKVLGNAPWGLLVEKGFRDLKLFDYRHLEIKTLRKQQADSLHTLFANLQGIGYFLDSTFYFGDFFHNTIDSLPLSLAHFESSGLYITDQHWYRRWMGMSGSKPATVVLALVLVAAAVWYSRRRRRHALQPAMPGAAPPYPADSAEEEKEEGVFRQMERRLLHLVATNAQQGKTTTISEINRVLGVTNKNLPTQKRMRSEVLTAINKKASQLTGSSEECIRRHRSTVDGRQMEYYIDATMLPTALEWCGEG